MAAGPPLSMLFACSAHLAPTLSAMSSTENRQQTFPAPPPSFSAGGHEMRDYYADSDATRPSPNQNPYLTPYLGLRARLSQVWINRWTVLLLLVLVRVLLAISSTNDAIDDSRDQALTACLATEKAGTALASMPYYSARGFNAITAHSVEKAVGALKTTVTLMITGVEEIVVFWIGMLTNTYLCLITLAVSGSMSAVVDALSKAQADLDKALGAIGDEIGDIAGGLQKGLQNLVSGINTVFSNNDAPKIDFSDPINKMKTLKLPSGLSDDLKKINNSIPTFDDVKNVTEGVIRLPFEEVKKLITKSWGNYTFDASLLPVPQKEELSFCAGNNALTNLFDHMRDIAHTAKKVFLGILLTAAFLACIPVAMSEVWRFRRLQERSKTVNRHAVDPMDKAYMFSRHYTSDIGMWASKKVSSDRNKILVRWCVAYCTSLPALFLLSLGVAGLFACLCQYILLRAVVKEVPALTAEIAGFGADVVVKLNNASAMWATQTNAMIIREGADINKDLLGWVNTSTLAVNNTLNTFIDETTKVLNVTFGGTPLFGAIKGVFDCLVTLKVRGVQSGLTWVHDHAHIDFPLLSNDTLTGGAPLGKSSNGTKDFFADPEGQTENAVLKVVTKIGDKIAKGIRQEAIISTVIILTWVLIFLIGLIMTFLRVRGQDKYNSRGQEVAPAPPVISLGYERPHTPAPAYSNTNHDLNSNAPYTLNPHPIPRQSIDNESYAPIKTAPVDSKGASSTTQRGTYINEKGGFI